MTLCNDEQRRRLLTGAAGAALWGASPGVRAAANALTTFRSPSLAPFVDDLPWLAPSAAPSSLVMGEGQHSFHRDLPPSRMWGMGGQSYLAPTLEAHRDQPTRITFVNRLCNHPFAADIDTTLMGVSELDKTYPRASIHLHGGLTEPQSDGHPMASTRQGFSRAHRYGGRQDACCMWYHDHALGMTRLNAFAGLAGFYLLRDDHDTGRRGNPLGLPTGEFELPIVLQDRIFSRSTGQTIFRASTYVPQGQWEGGQFGDVPVVNGKVMPNCKVARGLYRLRLLNASNLRTYQLSFSNGLPFIVIGSDAGLFNAPVISKELRIAPGERYDVLVDFSSLMAGDQLVLRNNLRLPAQVRLFGDPVITDVMRFSVQSARGLTGVGVPLRLRGGLGLASRLAELTAPVAVRNMSIYQMADLTRFPPAMMLLNNLPFDTTDVERPRAGTVEQWNFINLTTDDHPMHLHLARMKVIGRQTFNQTAYLLGNKRPALGVRWAPPVDRYLTGSPEAARPWEAGFKDTVYAPPGSVTRVLVQWPSQDEMGFDPDAPIPVSDNVAAGAPTAPDAYAAMASAAPAGSAANAAAALDAVCSSNAPSASGALRLNPAVQDSARTVRGYVWHCHVLDHEDHDMMLPVRIR